MAALDPEKFQKILEKGKWKKTYAYIKGTTHAERRVLGPVAMAWFKRMDAASAEEGISDPALVSEEGCNAAKNAFLCCGVPSEWKSVNWFGWWGRKLPFKDFKALGVEHLDDWVVQILERSPRMRDLVREMVKHGLCKRPEIDAYYLGMVEEPFKGSSYAYLKANRDVIDEVWCLLEIEGGQEFSLAAADKYLGYGGTWADAFVQLSEEGALDRGRLLDVTLDVLARDFAQFRAGWYSRFHLALKPTDDEIAERLDAYLVLLGSVIPPTVTFALKMLKQLEKAKRLPYDSVVEALPPVLHAQAKGTVRAGLRLYAHALKQEHRDAPNLLMAIQEALVSDHPDVQKEVLNLLAKHEDALTDDVRATLEGWRSYITPSLQADFEALAGADTGSSDTVAYTEGPLKTPGRLEPARAIAPVADVDEWIQLALYVLQNPGDIEAIERAVAGVPLLAGAPLEVFEMKAKPLVQMADRRVADPPRFSSNQDILSLFVLAVLGHRDASELRHEPEDERGKTWLLNLRRLREIAERNSVECVLPVLSAPTHQPHWIDPAVFEKRLADWEQAGVDVCVADRVIAEGRLALPPEPSEATFSWSVTTRGEANTFYDFELLRNPPFGYPKFKDGPWAKPIFNHYLFYAISRNEACWLLSWAVRDPERLMACGLEELAEVVGDIEVDGEGNIAYIEFLADPGQPMDWLATMALIMGLSSAGKAIRVTSTDVLIDRLNYEDTGFLEVLASELAALLNTEMMKPNRLAACLQECAQASSRHGLLIRDVLLAMIGAGPGNPKDLMKLLNVLNELLHQYPLAEKAGPGVLAGLDAVITGGKTAKLVKAIRAQV